MNREERVEDRRERPLLQVVKPPTPERRRLGPLPYVLVLLPGLLFTLSAIVEDYLYAPAEEEGRDVELEEDVVAGMTPNDELVTGGEDDGAPTGPTDPDVPTAEPVFSPLSHNGIVDVGP